VPAEADNLLQGLLEGGRTVARLARHLELALQPLELTVAQYRVLCALEVGAEASSSLAEKLAVSAPSVTTVVDGLVGRRLVDRSHDTAPDRRRVSISLTPAGAAIADQARISVAERLSSIAAHLDSTQAARAIESLDLWAHALDLERDEKRRDRQAAAR
jgi:DNA-binding MarR family transcriptional regulator